MSWLDVANNPAKTPSDLQDLGNAAAAGAASAGSGLLGAAQWVASLASESVAPGWDSGVDKLQTWRSDLNALSEDRTADMSKEMQDMLNSPLDFNNISANPMLYLGGQIARQAPGLAVAIAGSALTVDPAIGAGIAMGTMTAGDGINAVYSALDKIPDDELQSKSELYAGYRSSGMSEKDARKALRTATIGAAPAVLAIIGAAAGAVGGAGQVGRMFSGSTVGQVVGLEGKNFLQRAATGAAVGYTAATAQSGASDAATQIALARGGIKNFDTGELVSAALQGGITGALLGGVADAFGGSHAPVEPIKPGSTEIVQPGELPADEKLAMAGASETAVKPPVTPEVTAAPAAPAPAPVEAQPVQSPVNVPGSVEPTQAPTPAPEPVQAAQPTPAPVQPEPVVAPTPAVPAATVKEPAAPVVAPTPKPAPAPLSHDAVFGAASKTATIAKNIAKIAKITGADPLQVTAALKAQSVGLDIPAIRELSKTWVDNAKPLDVTSGGKNRTPNEVQVRADANTTAKQITDRFGPNHETEVAASGSANTPGVKEARLALAQRVGKMVDAANEEIVKPLAEQKVEFPTRFKDNTDKSADWNEHMLLLSEAKRLLKKIDNKSAATSDYQRFLSREEALRGGDAAGVKEERRAEGDLASRKGHVDTTGDIAEPTAEAVEGKPVVEALPTTKVPPSAKKPIAEGKTGPASPVRKIELTPEEKAKYEKPAGRQHFVLYDEEGMHPVVVRKNAVLRYLNELSDADYEKLSKAYGGRLRQEVGSSSNPTKLLEQLKEDLGTPATPTPSEKVAEIKAKAAEKVAAQKPTSIKQKIAAAAKEVDTKPTEAQAEAGNYAKGHVSIHGLDVTLENPKGSTRSGTAPDGTPWSVKMPDHYGYIKRTEGADGDHVDAYIGPHPDSEHVFLIEQRHAETGAFDEHKAMLGYENAAQAMHAYENAFSDGKASDRFGSLKPMSVDEFKAWLKEGDTTKPTDEFKATEKVLADSRDKIPLAQTREGAVPTPYVRARNTVANWLNSLSDREYHDLEAAHYDRPITETDGQSIPQMLDNADTPQDLGVIYRDLKALHEANHPVTSKVTPPPKGGALVNASRAREPRTFDDVAAETYRGVIDISRKSANFAKAVGREVDGNELLSRARNTYNLAAVKERHLNAGYDIPGYEEPSTRNQLSATVTGKVIDRLKALAGNTSVYVLKDSDFYAYRPKDTSAYYDPITHHIAIAESYFDSSEYSAQTLVHEMTHAAFMSAFERNPIAQGLVSDLMKEVRNSDFGEYYATGENTWYGFTNPDEFIAEAMSNPHFQEALSQTPVSQEMAQRLGLDQRIGTFWDALVGIARRILGLPGQAHSALDAMMRVTEALDMDVANSPTGRAGRYSAEQVSRLARQQVREANEEAGALANKAISKTIDDIKNEVESRITGKGLSPTLPTPKLLRLRTLDQVAQVAKRYGEKLGNAVRGISDALEGIRIKAHQILQEFAPHIVEMKQMQSKYAGPEFDSLVSIMLDSTSSGVYPNHELADHANDHVVKQGYTGAWQRAQHASLKARYDALPQELKTVYEHQLEFYKKQQDRATLGTMQNRILKALGAKDDAMAGRLFAGTETDVDKAALGSAYDTVKQASELSKVQGPYFPQMRRGTHVVTGEYKVVDPNSPSYIGRTADGAYEFSDKEEAGKFSAYDEKGNVRGLHPTLKTVHVDQTTGSEFGVEPDGTQVRLTAQDTNAVPRYRVSIQNKHVEFVNGENAARRLTQELKEAGLENVHPAVRVDEHGMNRGDLMSTEGRQLMNIIEKRDAYKNMSPAQKYEVQQAAQEMALRYMSSTRIQTRSLPRRFVAGASRDVVRNNYEYAISMSNYLGKLHHAPELERHMLALEDAARNDYKSENSLSSSAIYKEVLTRVTDFTPISGETKAFAPASKRLMALSFLARMMSPAHSVIHAMQSWMLGMPVLGARHGYGRTMAEMTKAYTDIGGPGMVMKGVSKTFEHAARPTTADASTFVKDILKAAKNPQERAMFEHLISVGTIEPDAGFELGRFMVSGEGAGGVMDKGISYLDGIARQLPRAVDMLNRAAISLAGYRMELKRNGGDHDAAVRYAQETTNLTAGNYSNSNTAPIFNHPLFKMSLQFKKYGQMVYGLIGHQIGKAVMNVEKGDRAEAFKALGTIAAMHIAIAGTLGLPTEPFKWLMIGANAVGLTKYTWSDVENWERQVLAHMVGKGAGELLARGVTRVLPGGLGFDVSGRLGISDLMSFGEPKSSSPDDVTSFLYDLVGGAPGSLIHDYINGAQAIAAGDFGKAAGLLIPLKAADDAIKAWQGATQGKVNKYGQQTMKPYTLQETLLKAFGFTPARQAETNDANNQFYNETQRNKDEVQSWQQKWASAQPAEKLRLWGQIEQYNKQATQGNKLTRAQLDTYAKNKAMAVTTGKVSNGLQVNSKTRSVLDENAGVYATN